MRNKMKVRTYKNFWERNKKSNGYLLRKTAGDWAYRLIRAILVFGLIFLIVQPLLNKISISFMLEKDLYDSTVISIPKHATLENYKLAMELMDFKKALWNSVWVSLLVSLLQVAACTLVGYGFARFEFPLKKLWFGAVILTIVIPPQVISPSLHLHFRFFDIFGIIKLIRGEPLNLLSSITPYMMLCATCMGLKSGLYIYMIRQFFRGIPKDLEEAAYVDGCGKLRTFIRIMLPDAKPIVTSCFLFAFVWQWTDSYYTGLFMSGMKVLSRSLSGVATVLEKYWAAVYNVRPTTAYTQCEIATGMLLTLLPLLLLYLVAQKGFVESLSQSGIKM
ncbi:MAG: carbohydrate ABC transporter permease [Lachnospiraceae bacterium]|nr:carbohydrate ABC transporter permease [Lachnospiraceae bacterium]